MDEFYWEDRPRYYAALQEVRRHNDDLTSWLEYCAEGLEATLERVWLRIRDMASGTGGAKLVLRPRQEKLLQLLRDRGSLAPREIWAALDVSKQGAMNLIHPLLEAGLITHVGTKKSGRYQLKT